MAPSRGVETVIGTVALLRRFPLRSAGGDRPARAHVGPSGLDGDRRWVLAGTASGRVMTAKDLPSLAALGASLAPHGSLALDAGDVALAALAAAAGEPVAVREAGADRHSGGAAVHLVSQGAAQAPDGPPGCDPGERANVVLALDPRLSAPGVERTWVGRTLRVGGPGGLVLAVERVPRRCLGVYAEVRTPGWIALGDPVLLTCLLT